MGRQAAILPVSVCWADETGRKRGKQGESAGSFLLTPKPSILGGGSGSCYSWSPKCCTQKPGQGNTGVALVLAGWVGTTTRILGRAKQKQKLECAVARPADTSPVSLCRQSNSTNSDVVEILIQAECIASREPHCWLLR